MANEKLKFKLQLSATYWDLPPIVEIVVNNKPYCTQTITSTKDAPQIIEFDQITHTYVNRSKSFKSVFGLRFRNLPPEPST